MQDEIKQYRVVRTQRHQVVVQAKTEQQALEQVHGMATHDMHEVETLHQAQIQEASDDR